LGNYDVRQIANLAKLFGLLFGSLDLPLHFLKVLDFHSDGGLTQPQLLFLYLLFDQIFEQQSKDQLRQLMNKTFKAATAGSSFNKQRE
jgi:hypothetical protein